MKVLIVTNMYPTNKKPSFGIFVKNIEQQFKMRGGDIDVCSCSPKINNKFLRYIFFVACFLYNIFTSKYDVIYLHFTSHTFFIHFFKFLIPKKTKVICHSHGSDVITKNGSLKYLLSKFNMVKSDLLVFPSLKFKEHVSSFYNLTDKPCLIYPSGGVDEIFYNKQVMPYKVQHFAFIGRVIEKKGVIDLINAYVKIAKKNPNIKLSILGSGKELENIIQIAKSHKLSNIFYHPECSQNLLPEFLKSIDCVVFPTNYEYESLGLVGLEAFASKKLLVVADRLGPSSYANASNSIIYHGGQSGLELALEKAINLNEKEIEELVDNAFTTAQYYRSQVVNDRFFKEVNDYVYNSSR